MSSIRQQQLPREPSWLARRIEEVAAALDHLRARTPDSAAADALLPPLDSDLSRWPQTTSATYVQISRAANVAWKRRLRVALATATSGGSTGAVRVLINGTVWASGTAGPLLDVTLPLPASVPIGSQYLLEVQASRTSGTGAVHAQVQLIRALD
ncbi:hypothetical protein ACFVFS_05560 [Kitasatospora sp. NPDC057692]|uniref:hypothetical protein n=1 Tax=Kitasatospora sp. NPDC057692 TaxID=3346215 RepID=UPI0036CCF784